MFTHILITSHLDFWNALFMDLPLKTTWKIQLIQNAAACTVMEAPRFAHVTPLLSKLH